MIYDTLDEHLTHANDIATAATPMGLLLAWCVSMQLVSNEFEQAHEQEVLRIRMQELKGSELLVANGGDLRKDMFNAEGRKFLDGYYPRYLTDYETLFSQLYEVADTWESYNRVAKMLTMQFMQTRKSSDASLGSTLKLKLSRWLNRGKR